jgi:hypothetical protein
MKTRKTFTQEDSIYEGASRLPEPWESHHKAVDSLVDCYECYPEKHSIKTMETRSYGSVIDLPLGEEYKLQSQIDNYSHANYLDTMAMAALQEEINNIVVK